MIKEREPRVYELPPEGPATLRLSKIIDQPQMPTQWGPKDKLLFAYLLVDDTTGAPIIGPQLNEPLSVAQSYFNSFGTKIKPSKLRKDIEKLLGRKLTAKETSGFDEQQLIGITVKAEIVHNYSDSTGKTYANIDEMYKNRKDGRSERPAVVPGEQEDPEESGAPF